MIAVVLATLASLGPWPGRLPASAAAKAVDPALAPPGSASAGSQELPHQDGGAGAAKHIHTVRAGETLWAIARRYFPEADPRCGVMAIQRENGLDRGPLSVGTVLVVPERPACQQR